MRSSRDPLRVALVFLLLASAVIFAVGTTIERHSGEARHETTVSSTEGSSESSREGLGAESHPAATESSGETLLGVNPDAPWLVAVVVVITVLLAVAIWARRERWLLFVVVLFGLGPRSSTCGSWCIKWTWARPR
jgi:hypothetical protein